MLLVVAVVVVALLVFASVYDLVAKRRGRYRSAAEWEQMRRARKGHLRTVRERRREQRADAQARRRR